MTATRYALFAVLLFGVMLRLWNIQSDPALWLDEVFSAKLAESPLPDLLLGVPRFDTHPPLYYLQLHFWAALGQDDRWLILNSVVLDVLAMASLAYVAGRRFGGMVGLWAAAIYAVQPLNVFFAENLRMYAQLFLLMVWLWFLLERRVTEGSASALARLGALALGLAVTLTHGMGFFVAFFLYLQALVRIWRAGGLRPAAGLVLDYIPVALAAGYSLGIGSFRQTEGMDSLDLANIGVHLAISLLGMQAPRPELAGYLAFALLLLPPLLGTRSRGVMLALVLLPALVLLGLSLTVKSVFMYRTIGLFTPFMALSLALFLADGWQAGIRWQQALAGVVLVVLVAGALNSSIRFRKEGYRGIAEIWDAQAAPDAMLITEGPVELWGIARYLPGAPQFSVLQVQPPVRDGMLKVKNRLQGSVLDRAGFFGRADHLAVGGRVIWPHADPAALAARADYWLLSPEGGACLRPSDRLLAEASATGKHLLHCAAP